jgi:hypothetical protein
MLIDPPSSNSWKWIEQGFHIAKHLMIRHKYQLDGAIIENCSSQFNKMHTNERTWVLAMCSISLSCKRDGKFLVKPRPKRSKRLSCLLINMTPAVPDIPLIAHFGVS